MLLYAEQSACSSQHESAQSFRPETACNTIAVSITGVAQIRTAHSDPPTTSTETSCRRHWSSEFDTFRRTIHLRLRRAFFCGPRRPQGLRSFVLTRGSGRRSARFGVDPIYRTRARSALPARTQRRRGRHEARSSVIWSGRTRVQDAHDMWVLKNILNTQELDVASSRDRK